MSAASVIAAEESDTVLPESDVAAIVWLIVADSMELATLRLTGSAVEPLNVND